MLLAIDVGNTQTVLGLFDREQPSGEPPGLVHHWRVATIDDRTADEHALLIAQLLELEGLQAFRCVEGLAIASSVPKVTAALREMARRRFISAPSVIVEPGVRTGVSILYDNPKEVGADRIANAVAAFDLYGGPCIVVDLGTATTLDAISPSGEYLGGAIVPGVEISLDALFEHAAALRRIELVAPRSVIGKSTVESMQSGAVFGFAAQIDGLCERFERVLGKSVIVATGGLAELIAPLSERIQRREPWLTLHGLRLIYQRNVEVGHPLGPRAL
jgi:type III pantothenate kinase